MREAHDDGGNENKTETERKHCVDERSEKKVELLISGFMDVAQ
jgi:hypothetical protein